MVDFIVNALHICGVKKILQNEPQNFALIVPPIYDTNKNTTIADFIGYFITIVHLSERQYITHY